MRRHLVAVFASVAALGGAPAVSGATATGWLPMHGALDGPPQPAMVVADRLMGGGRPEVYDQAAATPWQCSPTSCRSYDVTTTLGAGKTHVRLGMTLRVSGLLSVRMFTTAGTPLHPNLHSSETGDLVWVDAKVPPGKYRILLIGDGGRTTYTGAVNWAGEGAESPCERDCTDHPLARPGHPLRVDGGTAFALAARVDGPPQPRDVAADVALAAGPMVAGVTGNPAHETTVTGLAPLEDRPCVSPACARYVLDLVPPRPRATLGKLWIRLDADPLWLPAGVTVRLRNQAGRMLRPDVAFLFSSSMFVTDTIPFGRYYVEVSSNGGAGSFTGLLMWGPGRLYECRYDCP